MPGKFVFPGGRIEPGDRQMPVGTPLHPDAGRADAQRAAAERGARRARLRSPRSARPSRRPACCSAKAADEAPTAPSGPWSKFAEAKVLPDLGSCISSCARSRRPAARAASTRASLPPTPARSRIGSTARSARKPNWSNWSGCRWRPQGASRPADHHRDRAGRTAGPDRKRASATTCRCRSITMLGKKFGSGTCYRRRAGFS